MKGNYMLGTLGLIKGLLRASDSQKYTEDNFKPGSIPSTPDSAILCKVYSCDTAATLKEEPIFGQVDSSKFDLDLRTNLLLHEGNIYFCSIGSGIVRKLNTINSDYVDMSKDCSNYSDAYHGSYVYAIRKNGELWCLYLDSKKQQHEVQVGVNTNWKMVSGVAQSAEWTSYGVLAIQGSNLVMLNKPTTNIVVLDTTGGWCYTFGVCLSIKQTSAAICVKSDGSVYAYDMTKAQLILVGNVTGDIKEFRKKIAINTDNTLNLMWDTNIVKVANSTMEKPWIQFTDFNTINNGYHTLNENGILYRLSYGGELINVRDNCTGISALYKNNNSYPAIYIQDGDIYTINEVNSTIVRKTTSGDFTKCWGGNPVYATFVLRKI